MQRQGAVLETREELGKEMRLLHGRRPAVVQKIPCFKLSGFEAMLQNYVSKPQVCGRLPFPKKANYRE